jgi:hypothetical protein
MNLQFDTLLKQLKQLKIDPGKLQFWKKPAVDDLGQPLVPATVPAKPSAPLIDTSSSLARALGGSITLIDEYYFPPDIIGGMCPQVPGAEEETAWNAAAEACDSERVHFVWQSFDSRVWYLAVRSSELASHPSSWCPFAAVLPGMKESLTMPVCYTHYGEEIASMMTVTEEGLHIYRGTNPIVRAKAERMARDMGNAALVDLTPERIVTYTPVPWYSVSLFEDRARRVLALTSFVVSLGLTGLAFIVWFVASISLVASRESLTEAKTRTQDETLQLMNAAQNLRATPVRESLTKFVDLNEKLLDLNGYLEGYVIKGGKVRWRATVPTNVTADRINALEGKTIDTKSNGTVIGNQAEIDFEASTEKK